MNLGFIGLGIMGKPMALNLIKGVHTLFLNSRSGVPKELTDAMKSNSITFRGKLKFTRFWPTTGKKINPETNEVIKPIVRRLRINVGVVAL